MMSKLHMCLDEIIKRTRRFHYDVLLNEKHKLILRYIACLLNFEKVRDIEWLLADSDLGVKTGLKILVDKSLLRAREDTIEMQCLLQEMGKDIVRAQSNEAREREFLVDTEDICHVLEDNIATTKLLGISLDMDEIDELHIHESAFKGLCNLSFLIFYTNHKKEARWHIPKEFDYFPYRLRLLRWDNCPLRCMPSKFCPSNLVKLQMLGSKLQKLWEGVQPLEGLKIMDLEGSKNLQEIPDLSKAINLEILHLNNCSSLVELPSTIQYLNNLEELNMQNCTNLEILPTEINLKFLDQLDLSGCSQLRSFPDISTNISILILCRTAIEEVPCWIENFSRINYIRMTGCNNLHCVSVNIYKLIHLETVDFSNREVLTTEARLDQEILYHKQAVFFKSIELPGEEVPSYFTRRTTGNSLTIPLLRTSPSQPVLGFRACAVVNSLPISKGYHPSEIKICCLFKNRLGNQSYFSDFSVTRLDCHMVIFDCCFPLNEDNARLAEVNHYQVEIQFRLIS
ncbi:unnamed protein product, partial [Brassica oleracea]